MLHREELKSLVQELSCNSAFLSYCLATIYSRRVARSHRMVPYLF